MTDMLKYACLICFTNVLNVEGERPTYADARWNQSHQFCIGVSQVSCHFEEVTRTILILKRVDGICGL